MLHQVPQIKTIADRKAPARTTVANPFNVLDKAHATDFKARPSWQPSVATSTN